MSAQGQKLLIVRGRMQGSAARFDRGDESAVLTVCFNPSEYTIEKGNTFAEAAIPGLDSPILQYGHGNVRSLNLELLLDTYTYEGGGDVREKYVSKLERFLAVDGEIHAPPPCQILWGSLEFIGFLERLSKSYVLFKDDGTPVRVRVSTTWKEHVPVEEQLRAAPRSSPDKHKTHVVTEGDTVWHLAYRAYGDPRQWRFLAEANDLADPLHLEAGTTLVLPPLPSG